MTYVALTLSAEKPWRSLSVEPRTHRRLLVNHRDPPTPLAFTISFILPFIYRSVVFPFPRSFSGSIYPRQFCSPLRFSFSQAAERFDMIINEVTSKKIEARKQTYFAALSYLLVQEKYFFLFKKSKLNFCEE